MEIERLYSKHFAVRVSFIAVYTIFVLHDVFISVLHNISILLKGHGAVPPPTIPGSDPKFRLSSMRSENEQMVWSGGEMLSPIIATH